MKNKHKNIPIFIPHLGCPNLCVFCNQRSISGRQSFERECVREEIEKAILTLPEDAEAEIAYFGGSFTGIERELMIYLLELGREYTDKCGRIKGIRMSTRPDYINGEIIEILSKYPVTTVELGLQSMDDRVLELSKRGHSSKDAEVACRMIKEQGYSLVGQMMIGLPSSSLESEIKTAERICELGADAARIYPTVVFCETELALMARTGEYTPLNIDDAVYRSKEVMKIFRREGVECIRVGLCASENLTDDDKVIGGANHPALGELVIGELYFDDMCRQIEQEKKNIKDEICFSVPRGDLSKAIGQGGKNRERLMRKYGIKKIRFEEKDGAEGYPTLVKK